ncbi:hypothetical protein [Marinomonas sp. 2405UD68-3]
MAISTGCLQTGVSIVLGLGRPRLLLDADSLVAVHPLDKHWDHRLRQNV